MVSHHDVHVVDWKYIVRNEEADLVAAKPSKRRSAPPMPEWLR